MQFATKMKVLIFLITLAVFSQCAEDNNPGNRPPFITDFSSEIINVNPVTYQFDVMARDPDLEDLTYLWDFGDGSTKEGTSSESHEFQSGALYEINVTARDTGGLSDQSSLQINAKPVEISIDLDKEHQTIAGFGGFGCQNFPWTNGPFTSNRFIDDIINDLGVTIIRDEVPTNLEVTNDNDDPNVLDLEAYNVDQAYDGHHAPLSTRVQFYKDVLAAYPEMKFIATVWSPSPWMKANKMLDNGTEQNSAPDYNPNPDQNSNQLLAEHYDEFAEFCVAYVKILKQETGVDLYALSIQNEPRFSQFYQSCLYNGAALRDVLKVVGQRFEDEGLHTKLFVPEDVGYLGGVTSMIEPILQDPDARKFVDMIAVHGYAFDGITAGSQDAQTWNAMYNWGAPFDIPLWMTETSGFENNMQGAINLAKGMYTALKHGNLEAWVFWTMSGGQQVDRYTLMDVNGNKSKRYFVSKNFYKFIRPGAIRTEASSLENLLALSFRHPDNGQATVVLINTSDQEMLVTLSGNNLPQQWQVYVTSEQKDCVDEGSIGHDDLILSPRNSVVTVTGNL